MIPERQLTSIATELPHQRLNLNPNHLAVNHVIINGSITPQIIVAKFITVSLVVTAEELQFRMEVPHAGAFGSPGSES